MQHARRPLEAHERAGLQLLTGMHQRRSRSGRGVRRPVELASRDVNSRHSTAPPLGNAVTQQRAGNTRVSFATSRSPAIEEGRQVAYRRMLELAGLPMQHQQARLAARLAACCAISSGWKIEIEVRDFHRRPARAASTSALILQSKAQIVMADLKIAPPPDAVTGTRGVRPAETPLTPTEGAPGEPAPVVVDVDAPVGVTQPAARRCSPSSPSFFCCSTPAPSSSRSSSACSSVMR